MFIIKPLQIQTGELTSCVCVHQSWEEPHPFEETIRLGRDLAERRATMLSFKPVAIRNGLGLFRERRPLLDPTTVFSEGRRFRARNGDACVVATEVMPFPRASSVKQVFDVLHYFARNMEITSTEVLGDVTLRENLDDHDDSLATLNRFVASLPEDVLMDMNTAIFGEYLPASQLGIPEDGLGIIVSQYVDQDELFPYRPDERVRHDFTMVDVVGKHPASDSADKPGEGVVSITRWCFTRVRGSKSVVVSRAIVDRILGGAAQVQEHMWSTVRNCCI